MKLRKKTGDSEFRTPRSTAAPFLGDEIWRRALSVLVGGLFVFLLPAAFGKMSGPLAWVHAALALFTWVQALRLLLADSALRRSWMVLLALAGLSLLLPPPFNAQGIPAGVVSAVFLLFRKYRPYTYLSSRRRLIIALIGPLAGLLVLLGTGGRSDGLAGLITQWSGYSVGFFWMMSALALLFGSRLHFLRLKPKLAVVAILFSSSLLFVAVLVSLSAYFALGGIQAARGRALLKSFAEQVAIGEIPPENVFDRHVEARLAGSKVISGGDQLPWLGDFARALVTVPPEDTPLVQLAREAAGDSLVEDMPRVDVWAPVDTTAFFNMEREIWLLHLEGVGGDETRISAYEVNGTPLARLAELLRCDVDLISNPGLTVTMYDSVVVAPSPDREAFGIEGRWLPEGVNPDSLTGPGWKPLPNGFSNLNIIRLTEDHFRHDMLVMGFSLRLKGLLADFRPESNFFTSAIMISLGVMGLIFLFLELIAAFFGFRITTGITSAVAALHAGTRRLAEGDLGTRIDIPNEDEFGDLADSFNAMALAVKRGQEEAVSRERLERELEMAREIQQRLLPDKMPEVPGFEIAGLSLPSRQVGGDYFDFVELENGQTGIAIADVSGKGIPAAMLMSNLQASLHGQLIHSNHAAEIVSRMNDLLVLATERHMFATFFCGILDRERACFTYTNAGHNPPIHCSTDGSCRELGQGGLILGMLPMQTYMQEEVTMGPGDVITLFTDGITEAASTEDAEPLEEEQFGEERLQGIIQANRHRSAAEIKDAVMREVADFTQGVSQSDDITLVVIKRGANP